MKLAALQLLSESPAPTPPTSQQHHQQTTVTTQPAMGLPTVTLDLPAEDIETPIIDDFLDDRQCPLPTADGIPHLGHHPSPHHHHHGLTSDDRYDILKTSGPCNVPVPDTEDSPLQTGVVVSGGGPNIIITHSTSGIPEDATDKVCLERVKRCLPHGYTNIRAVQKSAKRCFQCYSSVLVDVKDPTERSTRAKQMYIEFCKQLPLYGNRMFHIKELAGSRLRKKVNS